MFGMDPGNLLILSAIGLIWTACLWKIGGWASERGTRELAAALIAGSVVGSFAGVFLVALSAFRTMRRHRAVAIARLAQST